MEPTAEPWGSHVESAGELIIEDGPQSGLARALIGPVTCIGRAEWCDLRVDAAGVSAWHCVVARTDSGLVLRDLQSEIGTQVQGQPVTTCHLQDGDLIQIGPVRLRVRLAEETRIAATLEGKRQELQQLRETVHAEQAALLQERDRYEERVGQVLLDLNRDRQVMAEWQKKLRGQGERLLQIRGRLRTRQRRQLAEEQDKLQASWNELGRQQQDYADDMARRELALRDREELLGSREAALGDTTETNLDQRLAEVEALAAELTRQRQHLADQAEHLAQARQDWQRERESVTVALHGVGLSLLERERTVHAQLGEASHQRTELEHRRHHLEAERARFRRRVAAWEADRDQNRVPLVALKLAEIGEPLDREELQLENARLRQRIASLGRQVAELDDEVERLACVLIGDAGEELPRLGQAA